MLSARVLDRISDVPISERSACQPYSVEGWDYFAACETEPVPGVELRAVEVRDARGLVAAAPLFQLAYRLDTPLQGRLAAVPDAIRRWRPGLVDWQLVGIGSPFADGCPIAWREGLADDLKAQALTAMVEAIERCPATRKAALIVFKDVTGDTTSLVETALTPTGFVSIRSLPLAVVDLHGRDFERYLGDLSSATRKDIRRKLKAARAVRIEHREGIEGLEAQIDTLYESTRRNSKLRYGDFEELPRNYFAEVSRALREKAHFILYWVGEDLAAFNLLFIGPDRIIDKFLGMAYPLAREHNLYVVSWIENVRLCLQTGRRFLQSGQTAYASKLRLGSHLVPATNFVRHRNGIVNRAIRWASPLAAFDRWDPDLRALRTGAAP